MKGFLITLLVGPIWLLAIVALTLHVSDFAALSLVLWLAFWAYVVHKVMSAPDTTGTVDSPVVTPEQITAVVKRGDKVIKRVTGNSR